MCILILGEEQQRDDIYITVGNPHQHHVHITRLQLLAFLFPLIISVGQTTSTTL
jgi:hypothetical protein